MRENAPGSRMYSIVLGSLAMHRRLAQIVVSLACTLGSAAALSASPFSTGFTYQGRLELAGQPVSGAVALRVGLYAAPSGGSPIGSVIEFPAVAVDGGTFSVVLNAAGQFGASAFSGAERYLEFSVKGAPESAFTVIPERVPLRPAPHAATAGAIGSRLTNTPLLSVDSQDRIGIATTTPQADLDLKGNLYVDPRLWGGTPTVTLAIGDTDTGINTPSDGVISLFSNAFEAIRVTPGGGVAINGKPGRASFFNGSSPAEPIVLSAGDGATDSITAVAGANIVLRHGTGIVGSFFSPSAPTGAVVVTANSGPALLNIDASGDNYASINFFDSATSKWGMGRDPENRFYIDETGVGRRFTLLAGGNVAIGGANPTAGFRLDVQGQLRCVGFTNASSSRYKHDIQALDSALDRVAALRPVRFTWNEGLDNTLGEMAGKRDVGMIAEEVAEIFPDAVSTSDGKIEGINYTSITAYAVQAIKEQRELLRQKDRQIEELNARLERLERMLSAK